MIFFQSNAIMIANKEVASMDVNSYKPCSECSPEFHRNCRLCSATDDVIRLNTPNDWKWKVSGRVDNYKLHWIFPLRPCNLARIQTFCPRNPEKYLETSYPKTWNSGLNVPYKLDCWVRFWQAFSIFRGCDQCKHLDPL